MVIRVGDCLDLVGTDAFDAIVTDPPYGLSFMGKGWDHGVPGVEFWKKMLDAAKPGTHLLAFGGTRTFHRLAVAIEDAGWEVRDCIMWVYSSGFPKSLDVSKAIDKAAGAEREVVGLSVHSANRTGSNGSTPFVGVDGEGDRVVTAPATDAAKQWQGWGTALKPAYEPIIVARKPLDGTVAQNILTHGTGAINVDACRIPSGDGRRGDGSNESNDRERTDGQRSRTTRTSDPAGRSPQPEPNSDLLSSAPEREKRQTQPQGSQADYPPCPRCGGAPVHRPQADGQASSLQQPDGRESLCRCATERDNRECLSTCTDDTTPDIESKAYTPNFKNKVYGKGGGEWDGAPAGRWPANLIHDGSDEVVGLFPETKSGVFTKRKSGSQFLAHARNADVGGCQGGDSGSAARFFKCCPPDELCSLCCLPYGVKHATISTCKTTHANSAASSGTATQATAASSAPSSATPPPNESLVRNVKSAGSLCDLCATSIAAALAEQRIAPNPERHHGWGFISEHNGRILTRCLASFAALLGNTDTTPTTQSLSLFFGSARDAMRSSTPTAATESESGQPSRLCYNAKASKADRNDGLPEGATSSHPCVKPTALMRYLCRLVTPPGGVVLDPFMGSGSTGKAATLEGFGFVGYDLSQEYADIAAARIAAV